jgi:hypothetical protein
VAVRFGLQLFLVPVWPAGSAFSLFDLKMIINGTFIVLWIIGLAGAINGQKKPIPFFGKQAQLVFSTL